MTIEWPKATTLTTPNVDELVEKQQLSFFLVGMKTGTAPSKNILEVSCKTKHILTI